MDISKFLSVLFFLCSLCLECNNVVVKASHKVYPEFQSLSAVEVKQIHRTRFHFQPPKHWMNGPMYFNGLYHFFYQYNPKGAVWGNIVWAHSVSKDLINWEALEPIIYPTKPFNKNGCWSGSATILPGNKPIILYTGIDTQNQQVHNYAIPKNYSDPYLREWVKPNKNNPIVVADEIVNGSAFRDPTTAWFGKDGHWRIVVGSRRKNRGIAHLYKSKDFVNWVKAKHPLHSKAKTGMWECPDFYRVIVWYDYYTVGKYHTQIDRYVPDNTSVDGWDGLRYDYGKFYASKSFFDAGKKRRILSGWANESDSIKNDVEKGWAGIQAIPRIVWLDNSGKQVLQWSVEELETLRGNKVHINNQQIKKGEHVEIKGITAAQVDVEVTFLLPKSLDNAEEFDASWVTRSLWPKGFKSSSSSLMDGLYKPSFAGFVNVDLTDRKLSLRSLIDHSVVESFGAGGKTCILSRVYPTLAVFNNAHLYAFNNGTESVTIENLNAWSMNSPQVN
uniref:Beta-fructofuranosidase n=1 Tax=Quercus lobata TaxID=97700 RepID=A0A7N2M6S5_QUELO